MLQTKARHLPHKPSFFPPPPQTCLNKPTSALLRHPNEGRHNVGAVWSSYATFFHSSVVSNRVDSCEMAPYGDFLLRLPAFSSGAGKLWLFFLMNCFAQMFSPSVGLIFGEFSPNMCSQSCESVCRQYFILAPKQVPNDQFA